MMIAVASEFGADFDRFVYFQIERGEVKAREVAPVAPGGARGLVRQLVGLEVDLLIAGRIAPELVRELEESGVMLIRDVEGRADSVMAAYLRGELF